MVGKEWAASGDSDETVEVVVGVVVGVETGVEHVLAPETGGHRKQATTPHSAHCMNTLGLVWGLNPVVTCGFISCL